MSDRMGRGLKPGILAAPGLEKLRRICLALPDTEEGVAWGHPVFKARGKTFCVYERHKGTWTVGFNVSPLGSLRERDPRIVAAQDWGKQRWLFMDASKIRIWRDIREAIVESYHLTVPTRPVAGKRARKPERRSQRGRP